MEKNLSSYRWVVLGSYVLAGISSQIIWITYAPVLDISSKFYGVSQAKIGLFAAVFPIVYLMISLPTGYFIDKYGFRRALIVGMGFLAAFSFLRGFTKLFVLALVFQTLAGVGQPFVMNSISKLVRSWFPEEESALATGIGTLSLMLGIILGLALTPPLTSALGLRETLIVYGIYSLLVLLIIIVLCKEPKVSLDYGRESISIGDMLNVMKNRNVMILSLLFFFGVGAYTAFTTWVEPLVRSLSVPLNKAGEIGSFLTVGGIIGSIVIPGIADKIRSRKTPLIYSLSVSTVIWFIMYFVSGEVAVATILFIAGFFFLSLAPLALDMSAESVGSLHAGAANSLLWEFSQIGSLVLIALYEYLAMILNWKSIYPFTGVLMLIMLIIAIGLRERSK